MTGLTNDYLEKLSKKLLGKKLFLGVFSANEAITDCLVPQSSLIFNTGQLGEPGIHFISIFVTKSVIYYFDSFGNQDIQRDIKRFIKKMNMRCKMLCKPIQHINSNFCGFYALAFLLWMRKKRNPYAFYDLFSSTSLKSNDHLVTKFIIKEIHS